RCRTAPRPSGPFAPRASAAPGARAWRRRPAPLRRGLHGDTPAGLLRRPLSGTALEICEVDRFCRLSPYRPGGCRSAATVTTAEWTTAESAAQISACAVPPVLAP